MNRFRKVIKNWDIKQLNLYLQREKNKTVVNLMVYREVKQEMELQDLLNFLGEDFEYLR